MFGFTREQALVRTSVELGIDRDLERRRRAFSDVLERVAVRNLEATLFNRSGNPRQISSNIDVVSFGGEEYFLSTLRDITEHKKAEADLRRSDAAAQMGLLGKDPDRLVGRVLWEEFPEVPNEEALRRVMSERIPITDELYYRPLGEWVENHMYPSHDGGLVTFQRYITARKRTEDELRKAQAELARVTRITMMGELAGSIAHEINQPLGAIVNNSNVGLRLVEGARGIPNDLREILSDIVHDANRASDIITRVRAMTQRTTPEKASLQLRDVIADVLALAGRKLAERRIDVRTELPEDLPRVSGDRVQLQQLLLNLVMNGIEAMSGVEDERRILTIRGQRDELEGKPAVLITVQDFGGGFRLEDVDRLFDAFYITKAHGMGMGLRISRSIVEAHGGLLWATPNGGPGATFFSALPVETDVNHA
jgi:C4-dicarboxylate-specific signal transduction histidine kinase